MDISTNAIGARTEAVIMSALLRAGKTVLVPFGVQRYDLAFEDADGFHRVQCKTGRIKGSVIKFEACSRHSRTLQRTPYHGDADYFGVYVPGQTTCFLVPVEIIGPTEGSLRIDAPKNSQVKGILYAKDFLVPDQVAAAVWANAGD
jgi:hypothetical protein